MKIKITPVQRDNLTKLRAALINYLSNSTKNGKELARQLDRQQTLQTEIAALESAADDSETAASTLATKRVQLEAITKRLDDGSSQAGVTLAVGLEEKGRDLLRQFAKEATGATTPVVEAYRQEVADKIRPYCHNEQAAVTLAYSAPAVINLSQIYTYPFGQFGITPDMLRAAIARADELLSGEIKWSWDPKLSGK